LRFLETDAKQERAPMGDEEAPSAWTSLVLFERYRDGDDSAADALFARYFARLTALARSRLSMRLAQRTDPEDIVQSVYRSFFVRVREGDYALSRGGDLWRLLAAITRHKLLRQVRHQRAGRRSADVEIPLDRLDEASLSVRGREPSPGDAAALADELEHVLSGLDPLARRVLELRLQGLAIAEIAQDAGRSERTVRRSLASIRERLAGRLDDA
jgi:RNA polymerase sigma-70 factor (ECF subfamily)